MERFNGGARCVAPGQNSRRVVGTRDNRREEERVVVVVVAPLAFYLGPDELLS